MSRFAPLPQIHSPRRFPIFALYLFLLCVGFASAVSSISYAGDRPNILWLSTEDIGPHLGCYGDPDADTPQLDAFAGRGLRFDLSWSNYPVCAPARTTIITGMYPAATGGGNMRSEVRFPENLKFFPQYLREAGYYCTNNSKTDYNHPEPGRVWDVSSNKAHYRSREDGQPFFAVFNYTGTHESKIRKRPHTQVIDPASVHLPKYHPDCPESRQDWAQYHDNITKMDGWFAKHLADLESAGLSENTIVIFFGDHGSGMPRGKRYPGDSGQRVPMIVHVPEGLQARDAKIAPVDYQSGGATDKPFCFVDLAPTVLSIAGIQPPEHMQGYAAMGTYRADAPEYAYGFRSRMDERSDLVRSIRDDRFVYMRNFMLSRIHGQKVDYQFETPTTRVWREMFDAGTLNEAQSHFWSKRHAEELYDLQSDPDEVSNLASDPAYADVLNRFRAELKRHTLEIRDVALLPEPMLNAIEKNQAPYDFGQSDAYPLEAIYDLACDAMQRGDVIPASVKIALSSDQAFERYWGAAGILARETAGVSQARDALMALLEDPSPTVRVTAAEALGRFGADGDRQRAVAVLMEAANVTNTSNFDAVWALNALQIIGVSEEQKKTIAKLPAVSPMAAERSKKYLGRIIADTVGK